MPPSTSICNSNPPTLQLRSVGAKVVELQRLLVQLGPLLGQGGIDGKFGTGTQNAVKKFQQDNVLPANGIVGPAIWRALCTGVTTVAPSSSSQPIQTPAQNTPPQISPSTDCDPTKSEIVYPSKVYRKGPWQFLFGVYKGQGLFVRHLSANSNPLHDSLSVPHFKIDYGGGKSKIIRFCNDQTIEPRIFSEVNEFYGKKYDRLGWAFERVMNEPDLKGVLRVNYDIIIRTDPGSNCEPGENVCYRFIPLVSFSWKPLPFPSSCSVEQLENCPIPQQIPQKFQKFTAFYKLDYGDDSGLVSIRDYNFNLANARIVGLQKFIPTENKFRAVTNGREGQIDNFHNAHLGQQVFLPGCRNSDGDCLHIHWRWGDMYPVIDPLTDTITDGSYDKLLEGEPYLVPGQTIDIALAKYRPQEAFPTDPTTLVNGEIIGSTKTTTQVIPGRAEDPPRMLVWYTLGSSYHPVMWYIASASNTDSNEFFRHGMFVLDTS